MRSTPCLPAVPGKSLSGLDLSITTDTNIGIYIDRWTIIDMMGNDRSIIGKAIMNSITGATAMFTMSR